MEDTASKIQTKKRVIILLRVSTKKQTSSNGNFIDDIPEQRKIVQNFVFDNDWEIVREFVEGGVSGFKIKSEKRDAITTIKAMALAKQFDILAVYSSDRVGRKADDTPQVVAYLNEHGVQVISSTEGEIKTKTHEDKLMTYFRYWSNENFSIQQSKKSSDYQIEAVKAGRFRGGGMSSGLPYGYRLVANGSKNHKGKEILDVVIDEEEKIVVELIYDLCINYNMGIRRIAKYLNDKHIKPRNSQYWAYSSIHNILCNPMFKGYYVMNSKLYDKTFSSPQKEELIIIPEEIWDKAQTCQKERTYKHNGNKTEVAKISKGEGLLSGITFCGNCNSRMSSCTSHKQWKNANGEERKTINYFYKCNSLFSHGGIKCEGQKYYSINRIDPFVEEETREFILSLASNKLKEDFRKQLTDNIKIIESNKFKLEKKISEIQKELKALKDEVPKALMGTSEFKKDFLVEIIDGKTIELNEAIKNMSTIENEIIKNKQIQSEYLVLDKNISNWNERFNKADRETKKMMIGSVVERVIIYKDEIKIVFNVTLKTFQNNSIPSNNVDNIGVKIVPDGSASNTIITPILFQFRQEKIITLKSAS